MVLFLLCKINKKGSFTYSLSNLMKSKFLVFFWGFFWHSGVPLPNTHTNKENKERKKEKVRQKEYENPQEVSVVLTLLEFAVIKIIQSFNVLYKFSKIRVPPEVNNKAQASCECQMWQQIALWCLGSKCLGSELNARADTTIMYFSVKMS